MGLNMNFSQYREFFSNREANLWGEAIYSEWARNYKNNMRAIDDCLQSCDRSVIERYCGYDHRHINNYLRETNLREYDNDLLLYYKQMSSILTVVIGFSPRVPEYIITYRAVPPNIIKSIKEKSDKGDAFLEKGFLSTTLTMETFNNSSEPFTQNEDLLKIYVEKNTVGVFPKVIAGRCDESELLMLPNACLRIIKDPYQKNNKKIHECQLMYFNHYNIY